MLPNFGIFDPEAFVFEQERFFVQTASVTDQFHPFSDDPVTGDDDGKGIGVVGGSNRPAGPGGTDDRC